MTKLQPRRALEAAATAAGLGVRFLARDAVTCAVLRHREHEVEVEVAWVPDVRAELLHELSRGGSNPVVLATRRLDDELLDAAKAAGVSVVDLAGNAHIDLPGLLVHVQGKAPAPLPPGRPAGMTQNTARLIRVLMLEGRPVVGRTRRELAAAAGLALGTLQRQLTALVERGWVVVEDGGILVRRPRQLLREWEHLYTSALRPRLVAGAARPAGKDVVTWAAELQGRSLPEGLFIGGAAGAALRGADVFAATASVHLVETIEPAEIPRLLRAVGLVPDPAGSIPLVRLPGAPSAEDTSGAVDDLLLLGELDLLHGARLDKVKAALRERVLAPLRNGEDP